MGEAGVHAGGGEEFWDSFMRGRGGRAPGGRAPGGRAPGGRGPGGQAPGGAGGPLRVSLPLQQTCSACGGSGAAPGGSRTCNTCGGSGMVQMGMGGFAFSRPCTQCFGRGQIITKSCPQCRGSGQESKRKSFLVKV